MKTTIITFALAFCFIAGCIDSQPCQAQTNAPLKFLVLNVTHFDSTVSSSSQKKKDKVLFRKADADTVEYFSLNDAFEKLGLIHLISDSTVYFVFVPEPRTVPGAADGADSVDVSITLEFATSIGFTTPTRDTTITFRHNMLGSTDKVFRRKIGDLRKNSNMMRVIIKPENANTPIAHSANKKWMVGLMATKKE